MKLFFRQHTGTVHKSLRNMLELSGLEQVTDAVLLADVKQTIHKLWGLSLNTCNVHHYTPPCTNPCSIMRTDLPRIQTGNYKAGLKIDGVRFYMLLSFCVPDDDDEDDNYVMLVDRACHTYRVPLANAVTRATEAMFAGTLLDGELYTSREGKLTYIVFDTVAAKGYDQRRHNHPTRLAAASEIVEQVKQLVHVNVLDVKMKVWYPVSVAIAEYYKAMEFGEPMDGLILVPVDSPLGMHTQRDLFKWKPAHAHTLDLVLDSSGHLMTLMSGNLVPLFSRSDCVVESGERVERNVVTEFAFTRQRGDGDNKWHARAIKIRTDKFLPNDMRVCRMTLQNIEEAITLEELA